MFRVWNLVHPKDKFSGVALIILSLFVSILDVCGVASIMPFMTILMNPEVIQTNSYLKNLYEYAGFSNDLVFIMYFGASFITLFFVALVFKAFLLVKKANYIYHQEAPISKNLLASYLQNKYLWFSGRNSSDLAKMILSEVSFAVNGSLKPQFLLFSQIFTIFFLVGMLIYVSPIFAFSVIFVFGLSYLIIHFFVKNKLSEVGEARVQSNELRYKAVTEAFGSLKYVKLFNLESYFVDEFIKPAKIFSRQQVRTLVIGNLPRYFVEGITFGGLTIFLLVLIYGGKDINSIIPSLTLYAFSGYRLVPAIQQVFSSYTQIAANAYAVSKLLDANWSFDGAVTSRKPSHVSMKNSECSFSAIDLNFSYEHGAIAAVKGVSFKIEAGSKVAIVGESGSGKSTLVDLMIGLLEPDSGSITLNGKPINSAAIKELAPIGYVPQKVYLTDSSLLENIAFACDVNSVNMEDVKVAVKAAQIEEMVSDFPHGYATILGENGAKLSGGQVQRIGIARALFTKPSILFLDEATSSIDSINEERIIQGLTNGTHGKTTVVSITHKLKLTHGYDTVLVMKNGKLVASGDPQELIKTNAYLKKLVNW